MTISVPRHSLFSVETQFVLRFIFPVLVLLVIYFSTREAKVVEFNGCPDLAEIHTLQGVQESQEDTELQRQSPASD